MYIYIWYIYTGTVGVYSKPGERRWRVKSKHQVPLFYVYVYVYVYIYVYIYGIYIYRDRCLFQAGRAAVARQVKAPGASG